MDFNKYFEDKDKGTFYDDHILELYNSCKKYPTITCDDISNIPRIDNITNILFNVKVSKLWHWTDISMNKVQHRIAHVLYTLFGISRNQFTFVCVNGEYYIKLRHNTLKSITTKKIYLELIPYILLKYSDGKHWFMIPGVKPSAILGSDEKRIIKKDYSTLEEENNQYADEIHELRTENEKLKSEIETLKLQIKYQPGGEGYYDAKTSFDKLKNPN